MAVLGYDITSKMSEALTLETGLIIQPFYGETIEDEEIGRDKLSTDDDTTIFLQVQRETPDKYLAHNSLGIIQEGDAMLVIFSKTAYTCVKAMQTIFDSTYQTELGGIGVKGEVFQIGNMDVWKWRPIAGINRIAKTFGELFVLEQMIDFAVRIN